MPEVRNRSMLRLTGAAVVLLALLMPAAWTASERAEADRGSVHPRWRPPSAVTQCAAFRRNAAGPTP